MILIVFDDWHIDAACCREPRQLDHLSQKLTVTGAPADRRWEALVQCGDDVNIISLEAEGDKLAATLTRDDLPFAGTYTVQLRGTKGEEVRHTNDADFYVNYTISGDRKWPTIPTEFTQLEERMYGAADQVLAAGAAAEASQQAAALSEQNAAEYAEKAEAAIGRLTAFEVDPETGELMMSKSEGYTGPEFSINEYGELEVEIDV